MAIGEHKKTDKLHRYILRNQGKDGRFQVYRCEHADGACGHYMPALDAIGRDTICWVCGGVCKVPRGRPDRLVKRPHCLTCTKVYNRPDVKDKPEVDLQKLSEMSLEDLLGSDFELVGGKKKKDED